MTAITRDYIKADNKDDLDILLEDSYGSPIWSRNIRTLRPVLSSITIAEIDIEKRCKKVQVTLVKKVYDLNLPTLTFTPNINVDENLKRVVIHQPTSCKQKLKLLKPGVKIVISVPNLDLIGDNSPWQDRISTTASYRISGGVSDECGKNQCNEKEKIDSKFPSCVKRTRNYGCSLEIT